MSRVVPFFVVTLLVHTIALADPSTEAPPTSATALRNALTDVMREKHVPGASYAIFDRTGTVLSGAIGVADQTTGAPVTDATLFRLGSITKTVTAIAILQLVEQGQFTLETPVSQLLPTAPIRNPYQATDPVRVVHLLTHTAGFDDMHPKAFFSPVERRGHHLESILANPEPLQVRWRPGGYESYSNPGYVLLGAILEAHYHQPWDEIVTRQVLQPLGITHAATLISEAEQRDHAEGHAGRSMKRTPMPFEQSQADGALWTNAQELAQLGRFLLTDGASAPGVLKPETVRAMKQAQGTAASRAHLAYGPGLGTLSRIVNNTLWVGHNGGVLGAKASVQIHPEEGMGYVLLINSDAPPLPEIEKPIAQYIAAQTHWTARAVVGQPLSSDIDGWYRMVNPRISLIALPTYLLTVGRAHAHGDELELSSLIPGVGYEGRMRYVGDGLLADPDNGDVVNGVILRDPQGAVSGIDIAADSLRRTSMLSAVLPQLSVIVALLLLLTAPFGKRKALANRWARRLPTLALLSLVLVIFCVKHLEFRLLAEMNWQTVGIWAASLLFPAFALAGVVVSLRSWRQESAALAKWRSLLGSASALVISAWLGAFHLINFAIWRW